MANDRYKSSQGEILKHIPLTPYSTGLFSRTRLHCPIDVIYDNPNFSSEVVCLSGNYNGYSVGKPITFLTFGVLSPYMPVVQCTLPHDVVCKYQMFDKESRIQLFKEAYDDAVDQFYDGVRPDKRRDILVRGVVVGSKYLGAC